LKIITLFAVVILSFSAYLSHAKMEIVPLTKTQEGHLEIQATINGVEAKFILDTGATGSIIDINKLNIFGITTTQEKIQGVRIGDSETGKIETFPIEIKQFSIGQKQLNIKSIYANDSSGQFESNVMGLIGYDALAELNVLLDVKNSQLLIPEDQDDINAWLRDSAVENYETVKLHNSVMGFSYVDVQIGDNQLRLIVDTGAPELILDESVLIQLGFKLTSHATAKSIVAKGIELPMKVLKSGNVSLGSMTLSDDFFTTDFTALMDAVNVQNEPRVIGILGNKHLVKMSTIIDVSNAKLYIKP
jgi:clan AA aspartic protease (TIGR02281 family)